MPDDRDRYWLQDMIDSANRAMQYLRGIAEAQFYSDLLVQDAVAWRLSIIGEAARRVTEPSRLQIPALPWKQIIQMRNKLIHEYQHVRADIIWATVEIDLPVLVSEVGKYLAAGSGPGAPP